MISRFTVTDSSAIKALSGNTITATSASSAATAATATATRMTRCTISTVSVPVLAVAELRPRTEHDRCRQQPKKSGQRVGYGNRRDVGYAVPDREGDRANCRYRGGYRVPLHGG